MLAISCDFKAAQPFHGLGKVCRPSWVQTRLVPVAAVEYEEWTLPLDLRQI